MNKSSRIWVTYFAYHSLLLCMGTPFQKDKLFPNISSLRKKKKKIKIEIYMPINAHVHCVIGRLLPIIHIVNVL